MDYRVYEVESPSKNPCPFYHNVLVESEEIVRDELGPKLTYELVRTEECGYRKALLKGSPECMGIEGPGCPMQGGCEVRVRVKRKTDVGEPDEQ